MENRLDLSDHGIAAWLLHSGRDVARTLGRLRAVEDWTFDGADPEFGPALAEFGELLAEISKAEDEGLLMDLSRDQDFLDLFRIILAYTTADRRLRVATWLCEDAGSAGAALLQAAIERPEIEQTSKDLEAAADAPRIAHDAARLLSDFLHHVMRRNAVSRIFHPDRLALVLNAAQRS
jgi:hypothetical protein